MDTLQDAGEIFDIDGQPDSNVGNMFSRIKTSMADVAEAENHAVRITDILAVDTLAPVEISGALGRRDLYGKSRGDCGNGQDSTSSNAEDRRAAGEGSSHQSCCCREWKLLWLHLEQ